MSDLITVPVTSPVTFARNAELTGDWKSHFGFTDLTVDGEVVHATLTVLTKSQLLDVEGMPVGAPMTYLGENLSARRDLDEDGAPSSWTDKDRNVLDCYVAVLGSPLTAIAGAAAGLSVAERAKLGREATTKWHRAGEQKALKPVEAKEVLD